MAMHLHVYHRRDIAGALCIKQIWLAHKNQQWT
jgi:hypothetical protein